MELDILKHDGQCPKLIYVLAMLIKNFRHVLSLIIALRYLHNNLLDFRVNKLLYFKNTLLNSSLENEVYTITSLF